MPALDARGGVVDGWNQNERRYTEPPDNVIISALPTNADDDVCEYDETSNKWYSSVGECPVEPNITFLDAMKSRAYWLCGLLALQSCSGFILSRNEVLLQDHPVIIFFLTMLVGAGGNAGNQASVRVIRGLGECVVFLSCVLYMAWCLWMFSCSLFHTVPGTWVSIVFHH